MTRGTYICDKCEKLVNSAHLVEMHIALEDVRKVDKTFTFALCERCDNTNSISEVMERATENAKAWAKQP